MTHYPMFLSETPHTLPFTISSSLEHKTHYPFTHVPVWNIPHVRYHLQSVLVWNTTHINIHPKFWLGTPYRTFWFEHRNMG